MGKTSTGKLAGRKTRPLGKSSPEGVAGRTKAAQHGAKTDEFGLSKTRFDAVMRAAEQSGLLNGKSGRIGGRVSPALVKQAKRQTGIETDTDLIEFALASVALEDNFADTFRESRGKVDRRLKLGF